MRVDLDRVLSFAVFAAALNSVANAQVTSDANGIVQTEWILGQGANTLRASVAGLEPFDLNASGSLVVATVAAVNVSGGNGQTGTVGAALAQPLSVQVVDADGTGIPGVTVTWTSTTGALGVSASSGASGAIASTETDTSGDGIAQVNWTLGTSAGTQTVTAAVGGITATFTASARAAAQASACSR